MTDREPLRVGPLVLMWDDAVEAWSRLIGPSARLSVYRTGELWNFLVYCPAGPVDEVVGNYYKSAELAADSACEYLRETGYLAQYRSRRRLLARECERRAEHWKRLHRHSEQRVCEATTWADRQEWRRFAASDRARAAKYARWANQLKDSP